MHILGFRHNACAHRWNNPFSLYGKQTPPWIHSIKRSYCLVDKHLCSGAIHTIPRQVFFIRVGLSSFFSRVGHTQCVPLHGHISSQTQASETFKSETSGLDCFNAHILNIF
jgi:hypothetical protein